MATRAKPPYCGPGNAVKRKVKKTDYWACVKVKPGDERRACHHIEAQGFRFYWPQQWVSHGDGLRRQTLFKGYIFVRVREGWQALNSTRGVSRVMMSADRPARIPDHEIDYLRSLEDDKGVIVLPLRFGVGDRVRIAGGQKFLRGRTGTVAALDARQCRVLFSILGHEVAKKVAPQYLVPA